MTSEARHRHTAPPLRGRGKEQPDSRTAGSQGLGLGSPAPFPLRRLAPQQGLACQAQRGAARGFSFPLPRSGGAVCQAAAAVAVAVGWRTI